MAGGKALAASGLAPADIDLVMVATCSTDAPIPNVAASVAHRLGIGAPGAFDLNAALRRLLLRARRCADIDPGGHRPGTCWSSAPRS